MRIARVFPRPAASPQDDPLCTFWPTRSVISGSGRGPQFGHLHLDLDRAAWPERESGPQCHRSWSAVRPPGCAPRNSYRACTLAAPVAPRRPGLSRQAVILQLRTWMDRAGGLPKKTCSPAPNGTSRMLSGRAARCHRAQAVQPHWINTLIG